MSAAQLQRTEYGLRYLASLKPPFFALHRGDRMAMVMTTSSACFACRAAGPVEEPDKCDASCLILSIVGREE